MHLKVFFFFFIKPGFFPTLGAGAAAGARARQDGADGAHGAAQDGGAAAGPGHGQAGRTR